MKMPCFAFERGIFSFGIIKNSKYMASRYRIILLVVYYGPFPWYFKYFLHTCGYNAEVNFVIITNNPPPGDLPANVRFENITLKDMRDIASRKLGFETGLHSPYKLCDFKPAYGYIFSDLIEGFEFWGHGDIDVIYGNIRKFMTDDLLSKHDVITVNNDFISGAFTLFRNSRNTNRLFMQSKDFEKVYRDPKHYCFDETNAAFLDFLSGAAFDEIATEVESMTHVVRRLARVGEISAYFNSHILEGLPGKIIWTNGTMVWKKKIEVMMYHLILFKHLFRPAVSEENLGDYFEINAFRRLMFDNPLSKPVNAMPTKASLRHAVNNKTTRNG
jgi:hypothetical protein